jgi:septal ring factor EnvC (AmiA/AmiB activator)
MRNKRRKINTAVGLLLTVTVSMGQFQNVIADTKAEAESRKAEYESMKESLEAEQEELQSERTELEQYTYEIDSQLTDVSTQKYELETEIADKEKEIEKTQKKLEKQEASIAEQYEDMKLRIQFMYEKGNTQFIAQLMSADSVSDFLNKAEYVSQITDYDRKMLDKMEETKQSIEDAEATLESDKTKLENLQAELEDKEAELEKLLETKEAELSATDDAIDSTSSDITSVEAQIQTEEENIEEIERIEEERKKAEAAAEAASKEAASKAAESSTSGSSTSGSTTINYANYNTDESSYSGDGSYIWPLPSQYRTRSSTFGYRSDPFGSGSTTYHCGDDYPAPAGTPIYAVADGTVDSSGYSSSTGNCVVIYHGNGLSSVYMHASVLIAKAGDTVKQGDIIALVGTTGPSTGNHLHISFRLNGNWVDPKNYIGG